MKYIRTKDGNIIDTKNKFYHFVETKEQYEKEKKRRKNDFSCCGMVSFIENNIWNRFCERHNGNNETREKIEQADTIEELCDEFVVAYENARIVYDDLEWAKTKAKSSLEYGNKSIIYGAIWTDKGLIYVAKMNEKGELELL